MAEIAWTLFCGILFLYAVEAIHWFFKWAGQLIDIIASLMRK